MIETYRNIYELIHDDLAGSCRVREGSNGAKIFESFTDEVDLLSVGSVRGNGRGSGRSHSEKKILL
jgi:hypothetical protein